MNKDFYISLISRKLSSELNAAELKALNSWLSEGKDNANLLGEFKKIWEASAGYKKNLSFNADTAYENFSRKYKIDKPETVPAEITRSAFTLNRFVWIAVAIAALILSVFLFNTFNNNNRIQNSNMSAMTVDINPSASVTLSPDSEIYTIPEEKTTDPAETSKISLTEISDLHNDIYHGNRLAHDLTGQAYFNVNNSYHSSPYTIQIVDDAVLAAHNAAFNIQNYNNESEVIIDVASGEVLFDGGEEIRLINAGQRLIFNKETGEITMERIPEISPFAWHKGILAFDNTPLDEVFLTIEKFYGVEVVVVDNSPVEGHFTAFNLKPGSLNELLELLQASIDMKIVRKGLDRVEVSEINPE